MRLLLILLAAGLAACSHNKTKVIRAEGEDFTRYHHIGILPFQDPKGQGVLISEEIKKGLAKLMYDNVDTTALQKVLAKYPLDRGEGLNAEALMDIHNNAPVDAILFGLMAPDWSAAKIILVEANMGELILQGVLKPKNGKYFANPDEVIEETIKVLTSPKYGS